MPSKSLRVLVIDDSRIYREIICATLAAIPGVEVVGTAANGEIALSKLAELTPDLLTLDVEMPVMDGLATLRKLRELGASVLVVMVSAHTRQGAAVTMEALQLGAHDFITKPEEDDPKKSQEVLESKFRPIINAILTQKILRQTISAMATSGSGSALAAHPQAIPHSAGQNRPERQSSEKIDIIAIGVSTGGPNALAEVLPRLPASLRVPIVIVQHMPKFFTGALAESLNAKCAIRVVEGKQGQMLMPGCAYIAPGGQQMRVAPVSGRAGYYCLEITDDPPENHCQPSVDYLFRSVAKAFKGQALAIIMTGMGCDGVLGLRLMKRHGAPVIAQDQASCVVYGMPQEAVKAGVVDAVLPLPEIAAEILRRIG